MGTSNIFSFRQCLRCDLKWCDLNGEIHSSSTDIECLHLEKTALFQTSRHDVTKPSVDSQAALHDSASLIVKQILLSINFVTDVGIRVQNCAQ